MSEYGRRRGVSEGAVRKAVRTGKIKLVNGRVDPALADAQWSRNRDAGQESKLADAIAAAGESGLQTAAKTSTTDRPAQETPVLPEVVTTPSGQPSLDLAPLTAARIDATQESASIRRITRRQLEGSLLEKDEVDQTWGEMTQVFKDRVRMIPDDDNLVAALLKCKEEAEVRSLLMRAAMSALAAMAKGLEGMAAA